jgi:hypothetical protein
LAENPPPVATVTGIFRYPVKGLSAESLTAVDLQAGETLPLDRVYAIENGPSRFDPENPRTLPKIKFLMLMRDERLAKLSTRFDGATRTLTISRAGKQVAVGDISTPAGRALIEQFLAAFMAASLRGAPKILSAPGHSFTDEAEKCVHVINLASVREIERVIGRPVDPLRFRANLVVDGAPPWSEFSWVGRSLNVGGARLQVLSRTQRCAATNVDPRLGARDMDIPATLAREWDHDDFGIYAGVSASGEVAVGDSVRFEHANPPDPITD